MCFHGKFSNEKTGRQVNSVADPECLSRILIFIYPGSNNSTRRWGGGGDFFFLPFLESYKYHKIVNNFIFEQVKKIFLAKKTLRIAVLFTRGLYIGKKWIWPDGEKISWKQKANKKGEKERKDKGKEKISDKKTEQEQCFIKLWETWKKMQAIGDIISYFFPLLF